MHILDDPRLKLKWAEKQLDALDELVTAFFRSNPLIITLDVYPEQGSQVLRMEFSSGDIPRDFSILAGYAIHDMRSSLDWLICRLSEYEGATDLSKMEFPIFWKRPSKRSKKSFDDKIRGLADETKQAIGFLQPYYIEEKSGPRFPAKSQMLWQLHQLDITDKHRGLIARATIGGMDLPSGVKSGERLGDGAIEVTMPIQDDSFDPKPSVDIAFTAEDVPDPIPFDRLWKIHNFIGKLIFPMLTTHIPE